MKLESSLPADSQVIAMVSPYKAQLDQEMNKVLAQTSVKLIKAAPERSLGYFMCDAVFEQLKPLYKLDIVVVNSGGIRIPSIQAGDITIGKVYELMPFDNKLVIMELTGVQLQTLADHMAFSEGWPVNEAFSYVMEGEKAVDVRFMGKAIEPQAVYRVAISDYLANGGSDCNFLVPIPRAETDLMIRDVLIDYLRALGKAGKQVGLPTGNRVTLRQ